MAPRSRAALLDAEPRVLWLDDAAVPEPLAALRTNERADLVVVGGGYTGLGVAATRFGADVMLDLLLQEDAERTRLRMVRERPTPFPPEPARYADVQLTRWSLARADTREGRRNRWLRTLDQVGLGFGS